MGKKDSLNKKVDKIAEFVYSGEKLVDVNEPIIFENKTGSSFDVNVGVIFHKSGIYEVSIMGNRTIVSKVGDRKIGYWKKDYRFRILQSYSYICSECGKHHKEKYPYCPSCGSKMEGQSQKECNKNER